MDGAVELPSVRQSGLAAGAEDQLQVGGPGDVQRQVKLLGTLLSNLDQENTEHN